MGVVKKNPKKRQRSLIFLTQIFLIFLFLISLPGVDIYQPPPIRFSTLPLTTLPTPASYPAKLNQYPPPKITAEGIIVIDLPSQVLLFEKNSKKRFSPASTTKIATALIAFEHYQPTQILEIKTVIKDGRLMGLVPGERISAENLIYGTLVHSANDAAYTLAENYPGGVAAFVEKMNEKVRNLGLTDTHFTNPVGFEDENHYTTAYDLTQLSRVLLANEKLKKIISIKIISVSDETYSIFHTLENVNTLLGRVPGVAGIKTGYTREAGEVLSTIVKRGDHEVLITLLKSEDRFGETQSLINWVFSNFHWVDLRPTLSTIPH